MYGTNECKYANLEYKQDTWQFQEKKNKYNSGKVDVKMKC